MIERQYTNFNPVQTRCVSWSMRWCTEIQLQTNEVCLWSVVNTHTHFVSTTLTRMFGQCIGSVSVSVRSVQRRSYVVANKAIFCFGTANICFVWALAFSMIFQALQTETETEDHQFKTKLHPP